MGKLKRKLKGIFSRRSTPSEKNQQPVPCPQPLASDPLRESVKTASEAEIAVDKLPLPEGEQITTLWDEAVNGLEPGDREKLDILIKFKRHGQAADGVCSRADHVGLVLSRAENLRDRNKEATWSPVSSNPSRRDCEAHTQSLF
jgi:hypothetical protein